MSTEKPLPSTGELNVALEAIKLLEGLLRWQSNIEEALSHALMSHSFNDVVGLVVRNQAHFFEYEDCFIIMQYDEFPNYKAYHCFLAGGRMESIMDKQETMRQHASALGCKYMTISGRPGWSRQLKQNGWKHLYSILFAEVENGQGQIV